MIGKAMRGTGASFETAPRASSESEFIDGKGKRHGASFETPAPRVPQDEDFLILSVIYTLIRKSARRARLEGRTASPWPFLQRGREEARHREGIEQDQLVAEAQAAP